MQASGVRRAPATRLPYIPRADLPSSYPWFSAAHFERENRRLRDTNTSLRQQLHQTIAAADAQRRRAELRAESRVPGIASSSISSASSLSSISQSPSNSSSSSNSPTSSRPSTCSTTPKVQKRTSESCVPESPTPQTRHGTSATIPASAEVPKTTHVEIHIEIPNDGRHRDPILPPKSPRTPIEDLPMQVSAPGCDTVLRVPRLRPSVALSSIPGFQHVDTADSRETMISYSEICQSSLEPNEPEFLRLTRLRRSGRLQLKDRVQYEESPGPTLPPTQQTHDGGANSNSTRERRQPKGCPCHNMERLVVKLAELRKRGVDDSEPFLASGLPKMTWKRVNTWWPSDRLSDAELLMLRVISDDDCLVHEVAPYAFLPNGWPREAYYDRLSRLKRELGLDDDKLDRLSELWVAGMAFQSEEANSAGPAGPAAWNRVRVSVEETPSMGNSRVHPSGGQKRKSPLSNGSCLPSSPSSSTPTLLANSQALMNVAQSEDITPQGEDSPSAKRLKAMGFAERNGVLIEIDG